MTDGYDPVPFQGQNPNTVVTRSAQAQMYEKILNHLEGAFGTESQIQMVAPNGEDDPEDIEPGMVVHLDATTLTFKLGLDGNNIPYFAKPAQGYSALPSAGNVYGDGVLALPACAPYKLCTNNFADDVEFAANTPLTVVESGDEKGLITPGAYYEDPIVGIVTTELMEDYDKPGRDVVEFFTYWLPEFDAYSSSLIGPIGD